MMTTIFMIFLIIFIILSILAATIIGYRYIFDGADLRSSGLISSLLFTIFYFSQILYFLITGNLTDGIIVSTNFYLIWIVFMENICRLEGLTTINISKQIRSILFIYCSLSIVTLGFMFVYYISPSGFDIYSTVFNSQERLQLFWNMEFFDFFRESGFNDPLFYFLTFSQYIILFSFDIIEKRWTWIKYDVLLLISFSTFFFTNGILDIIITFIPCIVFYKTFLSILKHSTFIDTRIREINSILKKIAKNFDKKNSISKLSNKEKYQLKLISNMITKDDELKNIVLQPAIFQTSAYKSLISYICYENFKNLDIN